MSARRLAMLAATAAAVAVPVLAAPAATAAPAAAPASAPTAKAAYGSCNKVGPWKIHTSAVKLRAKPTTHSTALGLMYRNHKFTVHSYGRGWVNVTDKNTHVRGWASMQYVYPTVYTCLPD
ncbi:SH3 domain-containing protein [Streptomyces noursei]|uniref:SH3 domain-containing protein n=1 Tax=Streptomyces noursei TaxID=1971 RepID=UPI0037F5316C